ncbi:hypothetical protein [Streptomyces mirabilis]
MTLLFAAADDVRAAAVAKFVSRLSGSEEKTTDTEELPQAALGTLAARGRLSLRQQGGTAQVLYSPSAAAKTALFEEADRLAWPPRVVKQMEQTQAIPGAIFRFPLVDGAGAGHSGTESDGTGGGGTLEAFITDWSPFPAACALAVHADHPLAVKAGGVPGTPTGAYVRHVLTGDLIPVWTADWVRPEFGTGTVVVNPAHSDVDLAFARSVGLPVRFGLASTVPTADPATWPQPPVLKTGVAVRTSIADGKPATEAKHQYLEVLREAGHAVDYTDHVLEPLVVAELRKPTADGAVPAPWTSEGSWADWVPTAATSALLAASLPTQSSFVFGSAQVAVLLTARALHHELHGTAVSVPRAFLVAPTSAVPDQAEGAGFELALLTAGGLAEAVSVKPQQLEQAERFIEAHAALPQPEETDLESRPAKRIGTVFARMISGQPHLAFAELYKIQRDIRKKPEAVSAGDRYAYFGAAYVLAGLEPPADYPTVAVLSLLDR